MSVNRKKRDPGRYGIPFLLAALLVLGGCAAFQKGSGSAQEAANEKGKANAANGQRPSAEIMDFSNEPENVIYLAGGCFWGIEHLMQSIPGVIDAESGYANGSGKAQANYQAVCTEETGFRETVRVEYDPEQVSLEALLLAYFYVIDPTQKNQQGNDIGSQYQTGVYYTNDKAKETVERIAEIERSHSEEFHVEIGPLLNYYSAEEYHQDYLVKTPYGYCHIPRDEMELFSKLRIEPGEYQKPATEVVHDKLTENPLDVME